MKTYCVPSISKLLDKTGEFRDRPQKRYDDTSIIVVEMSKWGYDSERGRLAIERMNAIHRRFKIANEDFLYVLSTFIYDIFNEWYTLAKKKKLVLASQNTKYGIIVYTNEEQWIPFQEILVKHPLSTL
ncbi:hypothetical protein [Fischerella sp.]|jgi:hypothetical protein|uniref:hypothetical protein n=1 Tax=Fischerella sp. TaxID=1191 RepID=UPI0025C71382|nr:hypothetical protein [Fischerella sp.]